MIDAVKRCSWAASDGANTNIQGRLIRAIQWSQVQSPSLEEIDMDNAINSCT